MRTKYWILALLPCAAAAAAEAPLLGTPEQIGERLGRLAAAHPKLARLHTLAQTPGGRPLLLLELGREGVSAPGVMVVGNPEGDSPTGSEAALALAERLLDPWQADLETGRYYIVPVANPDGYRAFFLRPAVERFQNARPLDDDWDGLTDEDGPVDLNGDGLCTVMREEHPEGEWLEVEGKPGLMRRADRAKGERGRYRLLPEGLDRDGDGQIAEDGPGGVNPGHNFPHAFDHKDASAGPWPASEPESRGLLRFAYDHQTISLVLVFGRENSLLKIPEGRAGATQVGDKLKVPEEHAKRMGIDPNQEFAIAELVEMARAFTGMKDIDEQMVLSFLGVGAARKPDPADLKVLQSLAERYREFLKGCQVPEARLDPAPLPAGGIEEWAYYQFGVLSIGLDFWALAKPAGPAANEAGPPLEQIEKLSKEEFLKLPRGQIEALLSSAKISYTADQVLQAVGASMFTPARIAELLRKARAKAESGGLDELDAALYATDPGAYLPWTKFDHPTLGKVEIGGRRPFAHLVPKAAEMAGLIDRQLPFVRTIVGLLPRLAIEKLSAKERPGGAWLVEAWIQNRGSVDTPTAQGKRTGRPAPVGVTLSGDLLFFVEGRARTTLPQIPGLSARKVVWVIQARRGARVQVEVQGAAAGQDKRSLTLGGAS